MHHTKWGLDRPPFPSGTDPRLFYEGASHREALARLRFVVDNRRRLGLLLAETGLGKSLLLEVFAAECRRKNFAVAQFDLLGLTSRELFWQLGTELQTGVQFDDQPSRLFRQMTDQIQQNRLQDTPTVLLLDNADQVGADLLTQLLRLVNLGPADNGLSIVLTANRNQSSRLGEQLLEMVDLRIDIEPWDELDTTGYLQLALVEAGSERPLFDDQAVSDIHHQAGGNPRRINRLADYALLIGSSGEQQTIDAATVQAAGEAMGQSCLA
jgi:type II secretory pathway predicted ATPase ExeA